MFKNYRIHILTENKNYNYLASSDPHPAKKSEFIRHLCVTFRCAIYIWQLYLTLVFVIHIWHVAFAFVFGIHLRLLYLTFTSYIYICHLCLTTIFDFCTLQGHGTPLGFSLDPPRILAGPKMWKTICFTAFLPAKVSKMSVCNTLTSKTLIK